MIHDKHPIGLMCHKSCHCALVVGLELVVLLSHLEIVGSMTPDCGLRDLAESLTIKTVVVSE